MDDPNDREGRSPDRPVHPERLTCRENLRRDEELLERGRPAVRVAELTDRAVSVGIGVAETAAFIGRAESLGWPVIRRASGGTAVAHRPGDLAWAIVLPRSDRRVGRDYAKSYDRLGRALVRFLGGEGVAASWETPSGLSSEYCLLGGRGSVLCVEGRAVGGAAQHLNSRALLHHGILARSLDEAAMRQIFGLGPRELDRLTCLEALELSGPPARWGERLAGRLQEELDAG